MKLVLNNISKVYHEEPILKDFNYTFEEGIYLFEGENGSGKSTLIKIIAGLVRPTNSNYYISNLKTSYLCERVELIDLKVEPFLRLFCQEKATIKLLLEKFNIPNKKINHLSKGNKQKVAIVITYLTEADLYLFDEPTDALDQEAVKCFIELLEKLKQKGKIIIIATHEKKYFANLLYKELYFK